jgi:predicted nucleic acid-binding protein
MSKPSRAAGSALPRLPTTSTRSALSRDSAVDYLVIVVDASVLADDGDDGDTARRELRAADEIAAPDLVDVKTVSVLRKRWLRRTLTEQRFANVRAYDACSVALAERLGCELVPRTRSSGH